MKKKCDPVRALTIAALGIALVCVSTVVIQFPIPLGYAHLGNCMILLFGVYFDRPTGAVAGGIGSALADLLTFPLWAFPTLLIKALMGFAVAAISKPRGCAPSLRSWRVLVSVLTGTGVMVAGYFLAGSLFYGGIAAGAAQIPGLLLEGGVGIVLFYALAGALEGAGALRALHHVQK